MEKNLSMYVDTDSMISFFKDDPAYGSGDKPYAADSFYTVDAPDVHYKGHSVMILEPGCQYKIDLHASLRKKGLICLNHEGKVNQEDGEMILSMIGKDVPSKEEWSSIFDLKITPHTFSFDGKLLIKQTADGYFYLVTLDNITCHKNLKYSFFFQIDGTDKIGYIDPVISNRSDDVD